MEEHVLSRAEGVLRVMLDCITPVILTYNEAPNITRTLDMLRWARDVVVVDSFSTDDTISRVSRFGQARVFRRAFDSHEKQWNFALKETGVSSKWVLALDADYVLTDDLVEELKSLRPNESIGGYRAKFIYCINGHPLKGAVYPPVTVLYRHDAATYIQDGHTQRVALEGDILELHSPILHDDRKSLTHWVQAQSRYIRMEAEKLGRAGYAQLTWPDRVRKMRVFAPFLMPLYCLLFRGGILSGRVGLYYALQRMFAEILLSLHLIEQDIRSSESEKAVLHRHHSR